MFNINNFGKIEITRGDSFRTPLFLNQGNKMSPIRYQLTSADTIYFAIMEPRQKFEDAILKKVYNITDPDIETTQAGDIYLQFFPKDTEQLLPGKYYYTIKLRTQVLGGQDIVQTVVPESEFYIMR